MHKFEEVFKKETFTSISTKIFLKVSCLREHNGWIFIRADPNGEKTKNSVI